MYSCMEMGFAGVNPIGWTAKIDVMKKHTNIFVEKTKTWAGSKWRTICRVGQEDRRRVFHSLKVGFSLTLVSLLYLMEPLFKDIGQNAIWAVMTVVVVLEFTAGATLCKGLNRGLGTLVAGSLAFLIEYIAQESGQWLKILPFSQNSNINPLGHSYRVHNVLQIAHSRFYTVAIGSGICLLMTLFILPNCNEEPNTAKDKSCEDPIYKGYKAVLDSKSTDETLALHASWEPCHSRHCYRFPWQQYVKLGDVLRHFGYTLVALHGSLQTQIQTPRPIRALFKDPCIRVAGEVHKALIELANSIRNHRQCSPVILSDHLHEALQDLDAALKSQPRLFLGRPNTNIVALAASRHKSSKEFGVSLSSVKTDSSALIAWRSKRAASGGGEREAEAERKVVLRPTLSKIAITSLEFSEALPFAAFASLLVEAVARLDLVIEEVEELGRVANFREFSEGDDKVSVVCQGNAAPLENHLPSHVADC
ncbi:hypothetical protein DH2020_014347 [Rehmannia glutinosa]|uniref:Uncharacterized protein n=1 Tax=Rehmannia glutinosa TaxID=99300 RepID=A0ABR0WW47_REHGL